LLALIEPVTVIKFPDIRRLSAIALPTSFAV
jgi:hypothetical protein